MNTQSMEALRHNAILYLTPKLGVKTLQKLLTHHDITLNELLSLDARHLELLKLNPKQVKAICQPDEHIIEQVTQWCDTSDQYILSYFAPELLNNYPEYLKNIASPPLLLFIKGNPDLLHQPQLAMVGSRNLTITGQDNAMMFASQIARLGIIITSGLAIGVDGYSHRGALNGGGKTVAVLGSGLNQIYPKRHFHLAAEIIDSGALVSEFLPNQTARAENFPRRNRIISGLSQGTLVVEAAIKSGSLITAKYALEQDREVFAIPGSIHNPMSKGCHALIKQGAKLVETIHDIIEDIPLFVKHIATQANPPEATQTAPGNKSNSQSPLLAFIGFEATPVDIIAQRSNQPVEQVLGELLELEIQGDIAAVAGGYTRL
ncbi:MAG: DNA processing protein [Alteromonadaceae bacterium]|jgi:DNA processing protein